MNKSKLHLDAIAERCHGILVNQKGVDQSVSLCSQAPKHLTNQNLHIIAGKNVNLLHEFLKSQENFKSPQSLESPQSIPVQVFSYKESRYLKICIEQHEQPLTQQIQ